MPERIESLVWLEEMSDFVYARYTGDEACLLIENHDLIEDPFDYFLQCMNIARDLQRQHGSEACPSEVEIVGHVLREEAGQPDPDWVRHKEECHACGHTGEAYRFLVENIWKSFSCWKGYFMAEAVLAYLRREPEERIEQIFRGFESASHADNRTSSDGAYFLNGILAVRELNPADGSVENCWYGLVRRECSMGGSMCVVALSGECSPVFRADFIGEMNRFCFWLCGRLRIEGGLEFYFGHPDAFSSREKPFAQTVKGVSLHDKSEIPHWEATFCGVVN